MMDGSFGTGGGMGGWLHFPFSGWLWLLVVFLLGFFLGRMTRR